MLEIKNIHKSFGGVKAVNGCDFVIRENEIHIQTEIKEIQKIRYGWKPYSRANLVNEAGLPASTFEIKQNKN